MYEFGSEEYWEQEQEQQYERELYEQQCREQEEQEYIKFGQHCLQIAEGWLLGDIEEGEASMMLSAIGDGGGLLEWAEEVLKGVS